GADPSGRVPGEHGAELGHRLAPDDAGFDRVAEVAVVARLLPVVAEDADAAELGRRDLRLARPVGAHQAHVLARAERALLEEHLAPGRNRDVEVGRERLLTRGGDVAAELGRGLPGTL